MKVNRVVAFATFVLGLAAAVAPVLADQDWSSPATFITGIGVAAAAALTWLKGWQDYEARVTTVTLAREARAPLSLDSAPTTSGTAGEFKYEGHPPNVTPDQSEDPGDLDDPGDGETVVDGGVNEVTAHEELKDG